MNIFLGNKTEAKYLQALFSCRSNQNLVELVTLKLDEIKDSLVTVTDAQQIHRLQGKAAVLKEFLEAIDKSQDLMKRNNSFM